MADGSLFGRKMVLLMMPSPERWERAWLPLTLLNIKMRLRLSLEKHSVWGTGEDGNLWDLREGDEGGKPSQLPEEGVLSVGSRRKKASDGCRWPSQRQGQRTESK